MDLVHNITVYSSIERLLCICKVSDLIPEAAMCPDGVSLSKTLKPSTLFL